MKITTKAVVWSLGDVSTRYRFEAIDHCEIRAPGSGGEVGLLAVVLRNGDREVFGVSPSVSVEVLRNTLEQRGVRLGEWTVSGEPHGVPISLARHSPEDIAPPHV